MVWIGFYGLVLVAWVALFLLSRAPVSGLSAVEYRASLCAPAMGADPVALFGMWALMLPTFAPALRVYAEVGAVGASDARGMAALVAGCAVV